MTTSIDTTIRQTSVRPGRRPRILVVDDARAERDLYSAHLRGAGYDVQVATDGLEAVARAVARRPDAIVLDMAAARLDGWEVTRLLKAAAATRDIPVIAVNTARGHGGEAVRAGCERAIRTGMDLAASGTVWKTRRALGSDATIKPRSSC